MERVPCVYILARASHSTFYTGVTSQLVGRVWQHREGVADGFTKRYALHLLVWFQSTESIEAAISREKQLKNWKRDWKVALVEKANPGWADLYEGIL